MGGGPDVKPEHLLIIIPFNEPITIIERIKKNHPNIKITFRQLQFADTPWKAATAIPPGQLQQFIFYLDWSRSLITGSISQRYIRISRSW